MEATQPNPKRAAPIPAEPRRRSDAAGDSEPLSAMPKMPNPLRPEARRLRRLCLLAVLASLAASSPGASTVRAADPPPNVVMLISDDQAWTDYGFMEHPHIETPRLDRLVGESLTFTRGYVPSSLCRPSLATMITGLFPHQHGLTGNDPPLGLERAEAARQNIAMDALITRVPTLPRLLGDAGYVSFQCGKWWEGTPQNGGFTEGMTHGDPARGGRHGDAGLDIGRKGIAPVEAFIDRAVAESKPFLLWYAPFLPHSPHTPPNELEEKYARLTDSPAVARYWAMCEWFDQTCGAVLDAVDERGLGPNTIVVYVCDNGWIQDPERPNRYGPRSKRSQYDGGLRTPIMVRWPGTITPKLDRTHAVSSIDLAPTILAACGVEPPEGLPGVNLADPAAVAARERIFGDIYLHNAVDIDAPLANLTHRWVVEGSWKLIVPNRANAPGDVVELFDLATDPFERTNLADVEPERVAGLRKSLDAWLAP